MRGDIRIRLMQDLQSIRYTELRKMGMVDTCSVDGAVAEYMYM